MLYKAFVSRANGWFCCTNANIAHTTNVVQGFCSKGTGCFHTTMTNTAHTTNVVQAFLQQDNSWFCCTNTNITHRAIVVQDCYNRRPMFFCLATPPTLCIQRMLYKGSVIGGASCSLMAPPLHRIQQMLYEEKKKAPLKKGGG